MTVKTKTQDPLVTSLSDGTAKLETVGGKGLGQGEDQAGQGHSQQRYPYQGHPLVRFQYCVPASMFCRRYCRVL